METIVGAMAAELEREQSVTRRLLERVPEDRLMWKPHAKSMTLGQLALHVAAIPRELSQLAALDTFDAVHANFESPQPGSVAEVLAALDAGVAKAAVFLRGLNEEAAGAAWRLLDVPVPVTYGRTADENPFA